MQPGNLIGFKVLDISHKNEFIGFVDQVNTSRSGRRLCVAACSAGTSISMLTKFYAAT